MLDSALVAGPWGHVLADNGMTGLAVSRAFGDRDFKRRRSGRPDIISCLPDYRKVGGGPPSPGGPCVAQRL